MNYFEICYSEVTFCSVKIALQILFPTHDKAIFLTMKERCNIYKNVVKKSQNKILLAVIKLNKYLSRHWQNFKLSKRTNLEIYFEQICNVFKSIFFMSGCSYTVSWTIRAVSKSLLQTSAWRHLCLFNNHG